MEKELYTLLFYYLVASIPGTTIMTCMMYLYQFILKKETRVIHIFGTMLTGGAYKEGFISKHPKVVITGIIAHFSIGLVFSFFYWLILGINISLNFLEILYIGSLSGFAAIITWYSYFLLHRNPPEISIFHYAIALWIAHILFAAGTLYFLKFLIGYF
ncbi:MAG: hypothetical protein ACOCUL_02300 [Bacteroidota bacterium]